MLRVLAVLAALTVVGGVLRFHAASDPSAYQSKDEQSYAMIARGLSVTGNYGNPGMTDPVHWPPGAPLMFALAYELKPQKRGGGVWDVPSAYPAQALVDINFIRQTSGGLDAITPVAWTARPDTARLNELLYNKRYSLWYEGGHRWIDWRRYGMLDELPKDRVGDVRFTYEPIPQDSCMPYTPQPPGCAIPAGF